MNRTGTDPDETGRQDPGMDPDMKTSGTEQTDQAEGEDDGTVADGA